MPVMVERMPIFDIWHAGRYLGYVAKQSQTDEVWHAFVQVYGVRKMKPIGGVVKTIEEAVTNLCQFHGVSEDTSLFEDER